MKQIIPFGYNGPRISGPVFLGGEWVVQLKVGRKQASRDAYLDPRAARRLACALLLQAEKVEMRTDRNYRFPVRLDNILDKAVDSVARFHLAERDVRKKSDKRTFRKYLKQK